MVGSSAGVVGKTGGDAHNLCVAAVDQETLVHFGFLLGLDWLYAIGSEVAAETSRSAERNAPANTVAVSRMEMAVNIVKPLCNSFSDPTTGPVPSSMHGACQIEKVVIFQ